MTDSEIRELIDNFLLVQAENELSENTISQYRYGLTDYFKNFKSIDKMTILKYKQLLMKTKKPKTVNARLTAINKMCDYLQHPEYKVKQLKIQTSFYIDNVISNDDYQTILNYCNINNKKLYWIIKFLACTGCRVNELAKLNHSCLKTGSQNLHSKGKERIIMIPRKIVDESLLFFGQHDESEPLFKNKFGTRLTTRGIAQLLISISEKTGVKKEVLHPHSFRHFFALNFLKNNKDINLLSSYLGHSNLNTTAIYLRKTKEENEIEFNNTVTW